MKKLLFALVALALIIKFGQPFLKKGASAAGDVSYQESAKRRVSIILDGIQKSGSTVDLSLQASICQWAKGVGFIPDKDELANVRVSYDAWRREKGYERQITGFTVDDARIEAGAEEPTAIVSCTVEGQKQKMRVPKGKPVSWVSY